jgi:aspartate/glutamate racemase
MDKKTVVIINTNTMTLDMLNSLCAQMLPDVRLVNIVDDSLLSEARENGITPAILSKMSMYVQCAEKSGADIIINQCSSVGEAVDILRKMITVPYMKIDEPMAKKAVEIGGNIAVIGTVSSTLEPSCRLIEKTAEKLGKEVKVKPVLLDGVVDLLSTEEGKKKHDEIVCNEVYKQAEDNDVVVLAQASMHRIKEKLKITKVPVLSSPETAFEAVKKILG